MNTKIIQLNDLVTAKFATLNKSNTLDEYKEECSKDEVETVTGTYDGQPYTDTFTTWRNEQCQVEQYFKVTPAEWEQITNNFLDDHLIWRGKGGTIYTGTNPDFDYDNFSDQEMLKDFQRNNARLVTIIEHQETGEKIAIDPQGYSYARYVGIEVTA